MAEELQDQPALHEISVRWPVVNSLATEAFNQALEKAQEWRAEPGELLMALQTALIGLIVQMRGSKDAAVIGPLLRAQCAAMCQEFEDGLIPVDFAVEAH